MNEYVALLRGINVGKANRVAMADLLNLLQDLGHTDVRTLLNSGNVVFRAAGGSTAKVAQSIEQAIFERLGLDISVVVVSAEGLVAIIEGNPLPQANIDPPKFLVAFVQRERDLIAATALSTDSWEPEAFALGSDAAYLWCANGIIESKIAKAFARATGQAATTRNWATVLKLQAVLSGGNSAA